MGERGPQPLVSPEVAFEHWYNAGERMTLAKAAVELGVSYATIRRYADDGDWLVRAEELDERVQAETDKRIASMIGRQRARTMEALATVQGRFFMRLPPKIKHPESGALIDNPAYLDPSELTVQDFERVTKLFELLSGNPTFRVAVGEGDGPDDDMAAGLMEMQERVIRAELATAGPAELGKGA